MLQFLIECYMATFIQLEKITDTVAIRLSNAPGYHRLASKRQEPHLLDRLQWRRQGGGAAEARAPAVKPCALAVPRQLSYSDVDHKRISWLRATDYFEDVNYDVINHAE